MRSRRLGVVFCAAAVGLAVSGCGGGGSSDGGNGLSVLEKWQRFADGNPTLRMTGAQVSEAWTAAAGRSTHYVALGPESVGRGADPASADPASDDRMDTDVRVEAARCPGVCDLERPAGSSIWAFAPVLEHDGIPVAELKARRTHTLTLEENGERVPEDETTTTLVDVLSYGGWLDRTEFRVSLSRSCVVGVAGCSETDPEFEVAHVQGFAAGVYSGTTPTGMGSATWTGVMIRMESPEPGSDEASALLGSGRPDVVLGDARITIDDLADPDADVSFTGIHNVIEGSSREDMSWENLRVQEDGLFGKPAGESDGNGYIAGMFTGSRHQEVGGHFQRDGIAGAFGARRQ